MVSLGKEPVCSQTQREFGLPGGEQPAQRATTPFYMSRECFA